MQLIKNFTLHILSSIEIHYLDRFHLGFVLEYNNDNVTHLCDILKVFMTLLESLGPL